MGSSQAGNNFESLAFHACHSSLPDRKILLHHLHNIPVTAPFQKGISYFLTCIAYQLKFATPPLEQLRPSFSKNAHHRLKPRLVSICMCAVTPRIYWIECILIQCRAPGRKSDFSRLLRVYAIEVPVCVHFDCLVRAQREFIFRSAIAFLCPLPELRTIHAGTRACPQRLCRYFFVT